MRRPRKEVKLMTYEDILGVSDIEQVVQVQTSDLHTFKDHPFKVLDNEEMDELVESIREYGIQVPLLLRPLETGGYEVISGHRRRHAAEIVGLSQVPAIIRDIDYYTAVHTMVASNKQREHILPSEKAFAYRMEMEANGHKGVKGFATAFSIGQENGDSARQVHRYIRLTYLIPELLNAVDDNKLTFQAGVAISHIPEKAQQWVQEIYTEQSRYPAGNTALQMKHLHEEGQLTYEEVVKLMEKKQVPKRTFTLKQNMVNKYFPPNYSEEQIGEVLYLLLERWKSEQN
jgi:ParB family chromosome partitioning protein